MKRLYGKKLSLRDGKILEEYLGGLVYVYDEHHYSAEDCWRLTHAVTLWLLSIADIASAYNLERCYSMTNLVRWPGWQQVDVGRFIAQLKLLLETIRSYDPRMGRSGFRAYKAWIKESIQDCEYLDFLRPLIYRLYGGDACIFRDLNTICQFLTRLTLQDVSWVENDAIDSYLNLEQEMANWVYPDTTVDCLRYIVTDWFRGFSVDGLRPDFSNGATSEVKRGEGIAKKVRSGRLTPELMAADAMLSFHSPYYPRLEVGYRPTAEGRFVPKGIDKKRFISMEPTVNQYYQYALFQGMDKWFQSHPQMHINLQDQETSRRLCLEGSRSGKYATIDLSSASDTVTWKLVQELFRDLPEMRQYMALVRTRYVRVNGTVIEVNKYAPMGSSLCFPVECVVFASIASYACYLAGIPQIFRVYGDDIVIDSRAYLYCLALLKELNFLPNDDKSYGPVSIFLEACGMEGYAGYDVTPCRLSRRFDICKLRKGMSPQQLEGSVEFANRLYAYGLFSARRYLVADILRSYGEVPFSVDPERGIYHPDPDNQHLECRFNGDLQRVEVLVKVASTFSELGNREVRYFRILEKTENRLIGPPFDNMGRILCGQTRDSLSNEWVPLWNFS